MRLEIHWNPGKTETFIKYFGLKASQCLEARRVLPQAKLGIKVPGCDSIIHAVGDYKHLGIIKQANGSDILDASHRCKSALGAYAPLAMKIFGSPHVSDSLKEIFSWSLVLSRLLFMSVPPPLGR